MLENDGIFIKYYESARTELIARLVLRDKIVVLFLGAVGAIGSVSFGNKEFIEALLIIPFLSLGALLLSMQHNFVIGSLSQYCASELGRDISKMGTGCKFKQWDGSDAFLENKKFIHKLRTWGQFCIFVLPCFFVLFFNHSMLTSGYTNTIWVWLLDAQCLIYITTTLVTIIVIILCWFDLRLRNLIGKTKG
ncbi:hypothetical protein [Vibrio parahaemolyticus]|uniref:hypothetical protein n=2 Tax=Vibrio parahaemolyticus TaxID=670 RepID=UPI0011226A75|nr:hypothetical protein [Vibrio parahaemolyticus]EGR2191065.1 hypothetical protein [Vibrio parahaemolyticus]TOL18319.1 hypothetical protein CGI02_24830 [Vibrio parahaemolyticus]TOM50432.1 hypothetical protein CGH75_24615 [Vibrio parahaemolyticus]TOM68564.1 hypothetical protein CGH73_10415 [Vibrio parahaemolyticus]TOO77499.1 hypothetical protein CGH29_25910 [Vibrio parahaemolyticus]